ncbi:MAG: alpha/beta hydrolase [Hyphomonadaceae bacterium]|nr:alpha/beta hydrolase [Hyphomonadaceae bacterium]MBP9233667.1 alpha/beta hydrolase [Hyphomonadaceae bacterium]
MGAHFRTIDSNGVKLRVAEMGKGPLVILVHGFPESWYSWRHQIPALAAAGYHVVAPDMRGYGKSDKPGPVEDYDIKHLTGDLVAIVDAMGEKTATLVGHDWGAVVSWNAMLLHPDRFNGYAAMSVPYRGRNPNVRPMDATRARYGENFWYTVYFQEPGVAEKEFDAQPYEFLSRIYLLYEGQTPVEAPEITDPRRSAGGGIGWIPRMGKMKQLPPWLTQKDLDYYVSEFKESGFRGGINYYRNSNRNWEITPQLTGATVNQPVIFIAGQTDLVIAGQTAESLTAAMKPIVKDLRSVTVIPGAGHWIQQEKWQQVNGMLIDFLKDIPR